MANAHIVVIVGLLMAVLLSAFAAERLRVCHGERRCLVETMPGLLPAARFFMVRSANRPNIGRPSTGTEAQPQPAAATPRLEPTVIRPDTRRHEADASPRPQP